MVIYACSYVLNTGKVSTNTGLNNEWINYSVQIRQMTFVLN